MSSVPNIAQMQQEAAARVRQMEERSRRLVREHPVNVYRGVTLAPLMEKRPEPPEPAVCPPETAVCPVETAVPPSCPVKEESCQKGGLAALFGGDNERMFILLLAAVLAKNGAPMELLLALLYVAL